MSAGISEYIKAAQEHQSMGMAQKQRAGAVVAQFMFVREGLAGKVEAAELDRIAATLTAGIFAGAEN